MAEIVNGISRNVMWQSWKYVYIIISHGPSEPNMVFAKIHAAACCIVLNLLGSRFAKLSTKEIPLHKQGASKRPPVAPRQPLQARPLFGYISEWWRFNAATVPSQWVSLVCTSSHKCLAEPRRFFLPKLSNGQIIQYLGTAFSPSKVAIARNKDAFDMHQSPTTSASWVKMAVGVLKDLIERRAIGVMSD